MPYVLRGVPLAVDGAVLVPKCSQAGLLGGLERSTPRKQGHEVHTFEASLFVTVSPLQFGADRGPIMTLELERPSTTAINSVRSSLEKPTTVRG